LFNGALRFNGNLTKQQSTDLTTEPWLLVLIKSYNRLSSWWWQ